MVLLILTVPDEKLQIVEKQEPCRKNKLKIVSAEKSFFVVTPMSLIDKKRSHANLLFDSDSFLLYIQLALVKMFASADAKM